MRAQRIWRMVNNSFLHIQKTSQFNKKLADITLVQCSWKGGSMVIFDTTTINEGIVRFEKGIPGFQWIRAMQLEQLPRGLWLLKSVGPHFIMIPPKNVRPDLELDIDDAVAYRLKISSPSDAFALSVVKLENKTFVDDDDYLSNAMVHLHSAIVINVKSRFAMQAVLPKSPHVGWTPLYA